MEKKGAKKKTIRNIPQDRAPMPVRDADERVQNFKEVACGFDTDAALVEAERCLLCPDPACVPGCPVAIDIVGFIENIADGNYRRSYDILSDANLLPAICGRVCPQEDQCEGVCPVGDTLEPVAIGRLERWIGDLALAEGWTNEPYIEPNGFKVGIVGSGPAGIACAADMAKAGCDVTIYEALHAPGGVLRYGIPEFRLPNEVIDAEMRNLTRMGVKIECNTLVGRLFTIEQMLTELGFHSVFIGSGAGYPKFMGIPGESLHGVLSANELLTRCNLMGAGDFPHHDTPLGLGKHVAVIGSGNTAMDAMRVALRLGAEKVYCVYRRTRDESPAREEEIVHTEEEGIEFHWLTAPLEILGDDDGRVRAMRCIRMELGEPDESGRRRPVEVEGSEYEFEADTVVYAIGTNANPVLGQTSKLKLNQWGYLDVDEDLATSMAGVYAGGDIVTGAATVILAMGLGRQAARSMKAYLGVRDSESAYRPEGQGPGNVLFGIDLGEKNFTRIRVAEAMSAAT
ncbi:MAG: NADPH-dependent glutamate synthase [Pseudomonadales bacterium]|jgi:glutamate synthase (NADPH/NADH) small chain|nr:NADPH-dependent glutamate synthase [Pseudomonadales bacterium]MDP6471474.1 NADPH-dependent glutamate synthase [Pseudomonadales bacterium]MDP6828643.1 NADPH-dependent glutamate synthase [Pseudomonadales bacterium]MDP6972362.1 NADPH-dependent glutamate synthase [Pseudomonadales bacterium]|tara:strand:+ start:843 stop:2381 length:1539 start_codon:yes stop_codon:yes gene_type:complete